MRAEEQLPSRTNPDIANTATFLRPVPMGRRIGFDLRAPSPPDIAHDFRTCLFRPADHAFIAADGGGMLQHLTREHAGAIVTDDVVRQLNFFRKKKCSGFGVLRAARSRFCNWCQKCTDVAPSLAGDVIVDQSFPSSQVSTVATNGIHGFASLQESVDTNSPGLFVGMSSSNETSSQAGLKSSATDHSQSA